MKAFDINLKDIENKVEENIIEQLNDYDESNLFLYERANNKWHLEYREIFDLPTFIDLLVEDLHDQYTLFPYTVSTYSNMALKVFEKENRTKMTEEELMLLKDSMKELLNEHFINESQYKGYLDFIEDKHNTFPTQALIFGAFPSFIADIIYTNIAKDVITRYAQNSYSLQYLFSPIDELELESDEDYDEGFDELEESVKRHKRRLYY